jgi:hypothetical protein
MKTGKSLNVKLREYNMMWGISPYCLHSRVRERIRVYVFRNIEGIVFVAIGERIVNRVRLEENW